MLLFRNASVYAPEYLGVRDVLLAGTRIEWIGEEFPDHVPGVATVDATGKKLVPGFLDQHVHITGGGGEGSFCTRAPEAVLTEFTTSGITTVVGLLGTDGSTRSVEHVLAKAKALTEEGITAYAYTGSYQYPSVTLTGSVNRDIVFLKEIIGAKAAISDHRSSSMTVDELARLASEARLGGMLSGKAGVLVLHMGDDPHRLEPVRQVLERSNVPVRVMRPTHVNRSEAVLAEAFDYARQGGMIDFTCGIAKEELRPGRAVLQAAALGIPAEAITISSDGHGSWSKYDEKGNMLEIGVSTVSALYEELIFMVTEAGLLLEEALPYITSHVAKGLDLYPKKGCLKAGADADTVLLDEDWNIDTVTAMGKIMVQDGKPVVWGAYEPKPLNTK